jgi:hypothetical protein
MNEIVDPYTPPPILQMCRRSENYRLVAQIRNNPDRSASFWIRVNHLEMKNYTLLNRIRVTERPIQIHTTTSVPDPRHFGVDPDPDPRIYASD